MENLKLQALSFEDKRSVQGGIAPALVIGGAALALSILNTDWDKAIDDFKRGFNSL